MEVKALAGGTTTGQGIRTRVEGSISLFRGAMRNVEETNDLRLPEAGTLVPDLQASPKAPTSWRAGRCCTCAHDLIQQSLVAIHALVQNQATFLGMDRCGS
ncbi:MAG: hypothetical protein C4289_10275, partial [Chloroflexota bacterium]